MRDVRESERIIDVKEKTRKGTLRTFFSAPFEFDGCKDAT
jgi:hypothetical protein